MSRPEQYLLDISWPNGIDLPRFVGPFDSLDEANGWALLSAIGATWSVARLAYPYSESRS